jgi:hypothetical protein
VGIAKEPGLKVSALVRSSSKASPEREAKLQGLKDADVSIVTGSTADSVSNLAKLFQPFDTIVSALSGGTTPLQLDEQIWASTWIPLVL